MWIDEAQVEWGQVPIQSCQRLPYAQGFVKRNVHVRVGQSDEGLEVKGKVSECPRHIERKANRLINNPLATLIHFGSWLVCVALVRS